VKGPTKYLTRSDDSILDIPLFVACLIVLALPVLGAAYVVIHFLVKYW
jgi:hypothetical protein